MMARFSLNTRMQPGIPLINLSVTLCGRDDVMATRHLRNCESEILQGKVSLLEVQ